MGNNINNDKTLVNLLRNGKSSRMTVHDFLSQKGYILSHGEPFWFDSKFYNQSKLFIGDLNGKLVFVGPYLAGDGIEIDTNSNSHNIGEIRLKYPLPVIEGNAGKVLTVNETETGLVWESTVIQHGTTEYWNNKRDYRPSAGEVIIYDDFYTDETGIVYAGMKIGTGNGYLNDLPFVIDEKNKYKLLNEFYNHINNSAIHVSSEDRKRWDRKLNIDDAGEHEVVDETLIFTRF